MRGAELVVPPDVRVQTAKWKHLGLIDVQHDDQHRSLRRNAAKRLRKRVVVTSKVGRELLFLVHPSELRGARVYLLTIQGDVAGPAKRDLFATNEAGLRQLEPYLR
jgi:hypothetical protein